MCGNPRILGIVVVSESFPESPMIWRHEYSQISTVPLLQAEYEATIQHDVFELYYFECLLQAYWPS